MRHASPDVARLVKAIKTKRYGKHRQNNFVHNTPTFYLEYTKNWLAHQRKAKANPAEIAIVEDIHKLVEIAVGVLQPIPNKTEPAEPAKK